jgi:hypothetical protein
MLESNGNVKIAGISRVFNGQKLNQASNNHNQIVGRAIADSRFGMPLSLDKV